MSDITSVWNSDQQYGDWQRQANDLATGQDLRSAVAISLFTDRVANHDDVIPDGTGDPRGWWADDDVPIGSRLWLLARAKQTDDVRALAHAYITEALQWLITDKVVDHFDITVEWTRPGLLGMQVVAYQPNGPAEPMQFVWQDIR